MTDQFKKSLKYHSDFPKGKWGMHATKKLTSQDMSLAYSPGVANPCMEIAGNPEKAYEYTSKQNLVAVITNGTAVLGLGNIGAIASKPVMEGKCVLMNKMSGVYGIDIEVDEQDPHKLVELIKKISPTVGAINLEDIKAPDCFIVESELQKLGIPVFHDDQHGTAIVATAGMNNALSLTGRSWEKIKVVANGAGAAGIACLDSMVSMGLKKENIFLFDSKGLIHDKREDLNEYKAKYASKSPDCSLEDAIRGSDIFLGMSAANVLKPEWLKAMNDKPIIFALANPNPEIMPDLAKEARPDCIIATGRSDFPNQVNNILCFPYIFRGALDSRATTISIGMKKACIKAISKLAKKSADFNEENIIPRALDERLGLVVSSAVAEASHDANGECPDLYGRVIEKFLNSNSTKYFDIHNENNDINLSELPEEVETFFEYWNVKLNHNSDGKNRISPLTKSCNGEKLIWIFGLDSSPWIAYSANNNNIINDIRSTLNFGNMPQVPVVDLKQCKELEKREDFCGRISFEDGINMEFKPGLRNIAYLTLLLSGIAGVRPSN